MGLALELRVLGGLPGVVSVNNPAWHVQGTRSLESPGSSAMWARAGAGVWVVYGLLWGGRCRNRKWDGEASGVEQGCRPGTFSAAPLPASIAPSLRFLGVSAHCLGSAGLLGVIF